MINFINKKIIFYFLITLLIFTLDRISKIYVINIAETYGKVDIYLNQFINVILVWNTGIGFGLLSFEKQFTYNFITVIIALVNLVILFLGIKSNDFRGYLFFIILGGSLGNLFDRIYYSAVPDFIDLNYNDFHWFIFNVADIFISIGIICLIFAELLIYKRNHEN